VRRRITIGVEDLATGRQRSAKASSIPGSQPRISLGTVVIQNHERAGQKHTHNKRVNLSKTQSPSVCVSFMFTCSSTSVFRAKSIRALQGEIKTILVIITPR
jgi:hypothetical protein